MTGGAKYGQTSTKKKELDRKVALFIAKDLRPLSVVDGDGFRDLVQALDSRYQLPSRQVVTRTLIPQLQREEEDKIRATLQKVDWIALTTDMWSSVTATAFLAVTGHYVDPTGELQVKLLDCSSFHSRHTASNIKDRLLEVMERYGIQDKVVCVVSDNAANVKKAISEAGLQNVGCFAHTLNLAINDALRSCPSFESLRQKISDLVTFLHQSNNGKEDFAACLRRLDRPQKTLVQDVRTRWNSVYHMLDRFCELKEAVILFQAKDSGQRFSFTPSEWQQAEDIKSLLEPAFEATEEISGESYVSGSKVIPITKSLMVWYGEASRQHRQKNAGSLSATFADSVAKSLYKYFTNVEAAVSLAIAAMCDPRYKREAFRAQESASWATKKLKEELKKNIPIAEEEAASENPPRTEEMRGKPGLWSMFDKEVKMRDNCQMDLQENVVNSEVLKYFKMSNLPRSSDPLAWWISIGKELYPNIYKVALRALIIPGSSVPSERVFSHAGSIISKKRSSLADDTAANLIFLKENLAVNKAKRL